VDSHDPALSRGFSSPGFGDLILRSPARSALGGRHHVRSDMSRFLYLAVVLDVWSRRVVGWAMENHLKTELVLEALNMAIWQRRPAEVIHHSDHGTQYTAIALGNRCRELGVRPSMGSVGDCYDNAQAESFFATLECEWLALTSSRRRPRRGWSSSISSRASTNRGGAIPRSANLSPINFERRVEAPPPEARPC